MRRFKIKANEKQLKDIGISYNITGLVGELKHIYPTNWYEIELTYDGGGMEFTNTFDFPKTFLEEV